MKALTLWQPWASLVAGGFKKVETRCWATKHRGPLAIHSAQRKPNFLGASAELLNFKLKCLQLGLKASSLPVGKVLCIVRLIDIVPTSEVRYDLSPQERLFGNYEDGRYAWFLELEQVFKLPIPASGNRMLWEWPTDLYNQGHPYEVTA